MRLIMTTTTNFPTFTFIGQPLTKEQSHYFISLVLNKSKELPLKHSQPDLKNIPLSQILLKRIEHYPLPFEITDFFMLISILTFVNSPGNIMILLRLCYQYFKKTNKSLLNIEDWSNIFPFGYPTTQELNQMWLSQKLPNNNNMVDYPELWT